MTRILFLILTLFIIDAKAKKAQLERIHWEKDIESPTTLVFKNHYGDIRLRSTEDQKLVFHGVAQNSTEHKIILNFVEQGDRILAEVMFENNDSLPSDHRLDAVVIVPSILNLDIDIENGDLSSKGLKSRVNAQSINSNITIKTTKNANLFSKKGDISFYSKAAKEDTSHQLKSHTGDVNVYFLNGSRNKFITTSGKEISSNDEKLLASKVNKGRSQIFSQKMSKNQFKVQTDTGYIRIINQENQ